MRTSIGSLSKFITSHARRQGVTMTELAKFCGFSRTTLYRYLRGDSSLGEKEEAVLIEALQLSDEEQGAFKTLVGGTAQAPIHEEAYACLHQILFQPPEWSADLSLSFAYYAEGEKYLRTAEELCDTIETECAAENAVIRAQVVNCTEGVSFLFLRLLMNSVFSASPFVAIEHLVAFPANQKARVASVLARLLPFLRYDGYHALYSSKCAAPEQEPVNNTIFLSLQKPSANGGQDKAYYAVTLYANGLCQCLRYCDASLGAFFQSHYDHVKVDYQDSLLYSRNLQAFNQELAEFEDSGDLCLYKPDPCYNDVPPEAYASLFGRMSESEKSDLVKSVLGRKGSRAEIACTMQGLLSTMEQRYHSAMTHPYRLICCREGLLSFIRTGQLTGNVANLPPFSMAEREMILRALYNRIAHPDGNVSILILPDRMLTDGTIISANRSKGVLLDFGGIRQQGFSENVLLRQETLSELLTQYAYSDELAKIAYSQDAAQQFINELLRRIKK